MLARSQRPLRKLMTRHNHQAQESWASCFRAFLRIAAELSDPVAGPGVAFSPQGVQTILMKPRSHFIAVSPGSKSLAEFERGC